MHSGNVYTGMSLVSSANMFRPYHRYKTNAYTKSFFFYLTILIESVQYVSRYYKVPQISYGSTSSEFTEFHSIRYPYFLRTTPNQNIESVLLAHLIASQGWKNIALIYTTNTLAFSSVQ